MKDSRLKVVGANVRRIREANGVSQEELAFRCRCHRNYVGLVERGERNPSLLRLLDICDALGVGAVEVLPPHKAKTTRRE